MLEEPEPGLWEALVDRQDQLDPAHQGQLQVVLRVVLRVVSGCSCLEQEPIGRLEAPSA